MNPFSIRAAAALAVTGLLAPLPALSANECFSTTRTMSRACGYESVETFWVGRANCLNDPDNSLGHCFADGSHTLLEDWAQCNAVSRARDDVCRALPDAGPYDPQIDSDDFVSPQMASDHPNPYFPLIIGRSYTYAAEDEIILVTVTDDTREILGVETTAVRDTVMDLDGELIEDTIDWYAQDSAGNVWYFGEIASNFEDGVLVDVEGSFTSGIDAAKPGIIMFASPQVGRSYRQEFALGEAEDVAKVLALDADESVPGAACSGACLLTLDYNPLEPGPVENKYYAPGVGLILEIDPDDGSRVELIDVSDD